MVKKTKKSAEKTQAHIASALYPGIQASCWPPCRLYAIAQRRLYRRTLARTAGREQVAQLSLSRLLRLYIIPDSWNRRAIFRQRYHKVGALPRTSLTGHWPWIVIGRRMVLAGTYVSTLLREPALRSEREKRYRSPTDKSPTCGLPQSRVVQLKEISRHRQFHLAVGERLQRMA